MAIVAWIVLRSTGFPKLVCDAPLWIGLSLGGISVLYDLGWELFRGNFGADLLAGIAIIVSILLGELLAGLVIVLMVTLGASLESYAMRNAAKMLSYLAKRMPVLAHRKVGETITEIPVEKVELGDVLVVFPHDTCPVDGVVVEGFGAMDESYLTGEPYMMSKAPGSMVVSGAKNASSPLTVKATKLAADSRYAQVMKVLEESQTNRPAMRRLADQLGAVYTPLALSVAFAAWWLSGDVTRFLSVLVVATPCPLLIAIPVAVLGAVSLAAQNGILIKNPAVLERIGNCRTILFDKTGTLTYGQPVLSEIEPALGVKEVDKDRILSYVASLERYSKHPLARAVLDASESRGLPLVPPEKVSEEPGKGLVGRVSGHSIEITSRKLLSERSESIPNGLPAEEAGLECLVLVDNALTAVLRFRDEPRDDSVSFVKHLRPKHGVTRIWLVSGDRRSEVDYLAKRVGIDEIFPEQQPEDKLTLVRKANAEGDTLFVGDGINDAPALAAATVGIAFGQPSDMARQAADAVILDRLLAKVDQLIHIGQRMRRIALESAVGGMVLSVIGMGLAAIGILPPIGGALMQEGIDILSVLNALRMSQAPKQLTDF